MSNGLAAPFLFGRPARFRLSPGGFFRCPQSGSRFQRLLPGFLFRFQRLPPGLFGRGSRFRLSPDGFQFRRSALRFFGRHTKLFEVFHCDFDALHGHLHHKGYPTHRTLHGPGGGRDGEEAPA